MNKHEIDRLIAEKVMGFTPIEDSGCVIGFETEGETLFFSDDCWSDWSPSADIGDAWQVAEKFKERNILSSAGSYYCTLKGDDGRFYAGEDEAAPMAICLAALKSVGVEVPV